MEGILLPVMYDVPNDPTIIRVTIDKDTVEGGEAHLEYGAVRKRYKNQTTLSCRQQGRDALPNASALAGLFLQFACFAPGVAV